MKKFFFFIAVAFSVFLVTFLSVAAFLPSTYVVERRIRIKAEPSKIFAKLADWKEFHKWQPWGEQDPSTQYDFGGEMKQVGSVYSWNGKKVGKGKLTIKSIEENARIENLLEITEPEEMTASDVFILEPASNGETEVRWINSGKLKYPIGRWFGLMLDETLGKDYQKGLLKLREQLEAK